MLNKEKTTYLILGMVIIFMGILTYNHIYLKSLLNNKESLIKRLELENLSFIHSYDYLGIKFPILKLSTFGSEEIVYSKYENLALVILLSNQGCNPCQIREMSFLDTLSQEINTTIQAIYTGINYTEAILIKKVSQAKFPIYFYKDVLPIVGPLIKNYPIILLIKDQIVINAFTPIVDNDMHSYRFYKKLKFIKKKIIEL